MFRFDIISERAGTSTRMVLLAEGGGLPEEEGLGGGGGDQGQGDEGRRVCGGQDTFKGAQPSPPTVAGPWSTPLATRRSRSSNSPPGPCPSPMYWIWRWRWRWSSYSHILIFRLVQVTSKNAAGRSLVLHDFAKLLAKGKGRTRRRPTVSWGSW